MGGQWALYYTDCFASQCCCFPFSKSLLKRVLDLFQCYHDLWAKELALVCSLQDMREKRHYSPEVNVARACRTPKAEEFGTSPRVKL